MPHAARQPRSWLIFDVGQNMRHLITFFIVALTACSTTSGRSRSAALIAQSFAEYYVTLVPTEVAVVHVISEASEAAMIAAKLQSASRHFVVKTDRMYLETKSEVLDFATGKRCIVLRLGLEIIDDANASVTVSCIDRSWTMMTYFLSFEKGAWKVTGSQFTGAS